jgi:hypothetical protein
LTVLALSFFWILHIRSRVCPSARPTRQIRRPGFLVKKIRPSESFPLSQTHQLRRCSLSRVKCGGKGGKYESEFLLCFCANEGRVDRINMKWMIINWWTWESRKTEILGKNAKLWVPVIFRTKIRADLAGGGGRIRPPPPAKSAISRTLRLRSLRFEK